MKTVENDVAPEKAKEVSFKKAYGDLKKTKEEVDQIVTWMGDRFYWADVLSELRRVLIRVEQTTQEQTADGCGRVDRAVDHRRPQDRRRRHPGRRPVAAAGASRHGGHG